MSTPTIERPGVQVEQTFRTATITPLVPQMPACIVGPCFQVIEAVQDDGSLNPDAQITLPAKIAFPYVASVYTSIGSLVLSLLVNNAAAQSITLPAGTGGNLTPAELADAINEALIPGLAAVVETSGSNSRTVIYTVAEGDNVSLEIGSSTAAGLLTPLAITIGYRVVGRIGYVNHHRIDMMQTDYPDPRANIDDLSVDYDTVRAFISNGAGGFVEVSRSSSFLDGASSAVSTVDDGDGDNLTPYLAFANAEFATRNARIVGTVAWSGLSYPAAFGTNTLVLIIDGTPIVTTFANPGNATAALAAVNAALGVAATASFDSNGYLVVTTATAPGATAAGSVQVSSASTVTLSTLGLVAQQYGGPKAGFARAQGITDLTAVTYSTQVQGRVLRMAVGGGDYQQIAFGTGVTSGATLVSAINALWGAGTAALSVVGDQLVLAETTTIGGVRARGKESVIRIDKTASDATLLTAIGLTGVGAPFGTTGTGTAAVFGTAYAPAVGDEVWVDGISVGQIVEIPVTPTNRLKLSAEKLLTFSGTSWSIVAKGLDNDLATTTRPSSDLYIDENTGTLRAKHEIFRDTAGVPTTAGPLPFYLAYTALRRDVSPAVDSFSMLRIGSIPDLETALSPIDTQNPLGLGMYLAMLNAPNLEVSGVGVGDVSTTEAEGTLDAYIQSYEYLESKDVYAIAPLTHSGDVGSVAHVHATEMSKPENGLERLAILNPSRPTRKTSTLVASGPLANVSGPPTNDVNTGVANLQALLAAAGKPGPTYTISDAVYLEFEDDLNKYLVESVSGGVVTIHDGPHVTGNTDEFYYDNSGSPVFTTAIVDRPFSIKIRGALIANRTEEAIAYADIARSYSERRVICTAPDAAVVTIDGLDTRVPGYYLSAALAGRLSGKAPQQPLTDDVLLGIKSVIGSHDRYSETHLKILSGGGLWVFYQEDKPSSPVRTRHQLTTDMSTVEKRELSITTALDFGAKVVRGSLRNFIGRFNITTTVQDAVTTAMTGITTFLLSNGVFQSFEVTALRQSASDPTRLELDCIVGVFYPLTYIKVTFVV